MASRQASRTLHRNRGQNIRLLVGKESVCQLQRPTPARMLASNEQSLQGDLPRSQATPEARITPTESTRVDASASSQSALPPESMVPEPSARDSTPLDPPSAAAESKQSLPVAPDHASSKQSPQPSSVVDFCYEENHRMNGVPAEVKFLECTQIWSHDAKSNFHLGIQLLQGVKVVAGDIVSITHRTQRVKKMGKITVVGVERRKDKLYLVGLPDKELPPPLHAGPNRLASYYSCPLLKSEWEIAIITRCELNNTVTGRLKEEIERYITEVAKIGNEGSLVEVFDSHVPYLRASARTKSTDRSKRKQSTQIEKSKASVSTKKKKRSGQSRKQKVKEEDEEEEEEEEEEEMAEDEKGEEELQELSYKPVKYKKVKKPRSSTHGTNQQVMRERFPQALAPVIPPPPTEVPPPGFHWVCMPIGSSHQWALVQIAPPQQQQPNQPLQQVQPLGQGGQAVNAVPYAPTVTGTRPAVNFAITNVFPS